MTERNSREHEWQHEKAPAPLDRTNGSNKSIFEVDLPAPQLHAAQVSRLPDTCRGLREQPDGHHKQIGVEENQRFALQHESAELYLDINGIEHRRTRVRTPRTNGFVERFNSTVLDEFFRVTMRDTFYDSVEALQADLDA